MRPFEILTLILIAGTLAVLFTQRDRKIFLYLTCAAILSMFLQFGIEGHRWQFAPAVYLLPAIYIFHRFQKSEINTVTKGFLSIWFSVAVILPWIIPVFALPNPGGAHGIGTETFHWVDSSRMEWFTDENPNDVREIIVQVWYPAVKNGNVKPEPYLDFINLRAKTLAGAGDIPEFFPSHLNHIYTNSFKEIPIIESDQLMPVVIFSHGITGTRHLHQIMYEYLASRGYIVVAPDHSFDANLTIFPDGHMADYRSNITGHPDSANVRKMQMNARATDISFIIGQLEKMHSGEIISKIKGKIDFNKIAVGGHSYGGSTATVSAQRDVRISACFVLDSWISPVPDETIKAGVRVPFLFMGRPTWEGSDYPKNYPRLDSLMAHSTDPKYRIVIKETQHLDFTDIPLFSPLIHYVMDVGTLSVSESMPLINNLVHSFLNTFLMGDDIIRFNNLLTHEFILQIK